jgi:hypothetical protein
MGPHPHPQPTAVEPCNSQPCHSGPKLPGASWASVPPYGGTVSIPHTHGLCILVSCRSQVSEPSEPSEARSQKYPISKAESVMWRCESPKRAIQECSKMPSAPLLRKYFNATSSSHKYGGFTHWQIHALTGAASR